MKVINVNMILFLSLQWHWTKCEKCNYHCVACLP